jgi:predicted membrane chloride channel (bestrophin family)
MLECIIIVFLVTYGFMGLTLAELELHDPLGDDANDLEISRYTALTVQDIENSLGSDETIQRLLSVSLNSDDPRGRTGDYGSVSGNVAGEAMRI